MNTVPLMSTKETASVTGDGYLVSECWRGLSVGSGDLKIAQIPDDGPDGLPGRRTNRTDETLRSSTVAIIDQQFR